MHNIQVKLITNREILRGEGTMIPSTSYDVPYVDAKQMIEVDRLMMEEFHIDLIQMMENAGRNLAHLARMRFLDGDPEGKRVIILAGTGGNGGGALVCARRLYNWGTHVQIYVTKPSDEFAPIPAHQLMILQRMNVPIVYASAMDKATPSDLIIDGVIGYSLKGRPRDSAADLILWANAQVVPILALDVPSGIDSNSGAIFAPAIKATATMTLALPKVGFRSPDVEEYVGELYLADISVPTALYAAPTLGLEVGNLFAESEIIRLW
jgi:NAD(P)H-hydrate epimerase